jgi:hypothetical protein
MPENVQPAVPLEDVVSVDSETEHPARAEEFAAVAVLATLAYGADGTGSMLPPLWPRVLHCCFTDIIFPTAMPGVTSIPELIRALRSSIPRHNLGGTLGFGNLTESRDIIGESLDEIIAAGAVPVLARLLGNAAVYPAMQRNARWLLAAIASSSTNTQLARVARTPRALTSIINLLGRCDDRVAKLVVLALLRVADQSTAFRDHVLQHGALAKLLDVVSRTHISESLRRDTLVSISRLCRGVPAPPLSLITVAFPHLVELIQSPGDEACEAMWTLSYICDANAHDRISAAIEHGVLPAITRILSTTFGTPKTRPAVHCLGNIIASSDHRAQTVEHGAIPALCTMLIWPTPGMGVQKTVIVQMLATIATGSADRVHALLQAGALDPIAVDMCSGDYGLRQKCQWAVGIALRDASSSDCAVIIQSRAFQGLLAAAQEWRPFTPAVEGVAVAFERAFDIVATVVSADALRQLVETLSASADVKEECRGAIDRIRGIVGRGT